MKKFECKYDYDYYGKCPVELCEECRYYSCRYCSNAFCLGPCSEDCPMKKKTDVTDAVIASAIPFDEPPF